MTESNIDCPTSPPTRLTEKLFLGTFQVIATNANQNQEKSNLRSIARETLVSISAYVTKACNVQLNTKFALDIQIFNTVASPGNTLVFVFHRLFLAILLNFACRINLKVTRYWLCVIL